MNRSIMSVGILFSSNRACFKCSCCRFVSQQIVLHTIGFYWITLHYHGDVSVCFQVVFQLQNNAHNNCIVFVNPITIFNHRIIKPNWLQIYRCFHFTHPISIVTICILWAISVSEKSINFSVLNRGTWPCFQNNLGPKQGGMNTITMLIWRLNNNQIRTTSPVV